MVTGMTTWLLRLETSGDGPRLAVKDAIDVRDVPTTAGCPVIGDRAKPAERDAPVVAAARLAGARIVGKTNLTELCRSADGVNPWTGTPRNPLDPERLPGGSSSGSAVAVATGEAEVALGTDTAGSIRIPAACCGVAGLKPTYDRLSRDGVFALATSLDTVGPMGRNVAAVALGMRLIEPAFDPDDGRPEPESGDTPTEGPVGRLRPAGVDIDPALDAAVDAALAGAGYTPVDEVADAWQAALKAGNTLILGEGYRAHRALLAYPDRMSSRIRRRIERGARISDAEIDEAHSTRSRMTAFFDALLARYPVLALPTLSHLAPLIGTERDVDLTELTLPFNLTGLPALALPIPVQGESLPGSLQLVAAPGADEMLLRVGAQIEAAL
jgi:amidase